MTKFKAFADDKLNIAKMTITLCGGLENTVGKEEKCWLPAFSSFPTVFSKAFFFRVVKVGNVWQKINRIKFEPLAHNPEFLMTRRKRHFENIVGEGEHTGNQYFLLFHQSFLPCQRQI